MAQTELYVTDWHDLDVSSNKDHSDESTDSNESNPRSRKEHICKNKFVVRAFCRTADGDSAALDIHNVQPYFFIKVPNNWTEFHERLFVNGIKSRVKKWVADTLVSTKLVNAKPFYGFTAHDKFRYMRLNFTCLTGFHQYSKIFSEKLRFVSLNGGEPYHYEPYESNLPPLLRFIHCRDIKSIGWLSINNIRVVYPNETTCTLRYECDVEDVHPLTPERMTIPKIKYLGFDIESDSSHGDFPIANKDYQKLAREIITEYGHVRDQRGPIDMRPIIGTFLYYAFHPCYNNYNIQSVVLDIPLGMPSVTDVIDGCWLPDKIRKTISDHVSNIYNILQDQDDSGESRTDRILDILEHYFPVLNTDLSDYLSVAQQLVSEYDRQIQQNTKQIRNDPLGCLSIMMELVFHPYYSNLGINCVYTAFKKRPSREILVNIVPSIKDICEKAYANVMEERRIRRLKRNGVKIKRTDNHVNKNALEQCITSLTEILNRYLPKPEDDPIVQIGSVFKRYGETDCYLKHIICLKGCDPISNRTMIDHEYQGIQLPKEEIISYIKSHHPNEQIKKDDLSWLDEWNIKVLRERAEKQYETDKAEVIVETYDTEEDVLMAWQELIVREDPDIVVGYNTFGFDYKYMYNRAEQLGIIGDFSRLGRIRNTEQQLLKKELNSAGMGENLLYIIEMQGRISIDLYKVMQRMHKMDSYKLDSVCREFLYKKKVDVSPQEIFIKQRGSDAERREIAEYCLIDCILCIRLVDRFDLILNNIGMAQVCSIPLSYLFLRGQGIKLFSYVAKRCREKGYLLPVIESDEEEGKYEGAIVLDPVKGIHYDQPVVVADFNSLYPSCMISENLSHDSFVGSLVVKKGESVDKRGECLTSSRYEAALVAGEYPGWDYVDIVYDVYREVPVAAGRKKLVKIVVGHKICRFAQPPDGAKSIIPTILMDLLAARKATREKQKAFHYTTFEYALYEGLQLAFKVTGNSLYGYIGASSSKIRLKEVAACTTSVGRRLIGFSSKFVLNNYLNSSITYGDTDSIFCKFKCVNTYAKDDGTTEEVQLVGLDAVYRSIMLCTEAVYLISSQLKYPHNLAFEKAIYPFILLSKKRYHGHYFEEYGSAKYKAKSMGIVLKRRDNAPIVKHIFGGMVNIIMNDLSVEKALTYVKEESKKVLEGKFPQEQFVISKTLRSFYKAPEAIAHNVLAMRIGKRDPGNKPQSNDRIAFAYIVNPDAELQGERIETPEYITKNKLKIDYGHYITNQIAKPVGQIFDLAGQGARLFDRLLEDYYVDLSGQRRLTNEQYPGMFKYLDKSKISVAVDHIKDSSDEDSDSDEDVESDETTDERSGGWL